MIEAIIEEADKQTNQQADVKSRVMDAARSGFNTVRSEGRFNRLLSEFEREHPTDGIFKREEVGLVFVTRIMNDGKRQLFTIVRDIDEENNKASLLVVLDYGMMLSPKTTKDDMGTMVGFMRATFAYFKWRGLELTAFDPSRTEEVISKNASVTNVE